MREKTASLVRGIAIAIALGFGLHSAPAHAQATCPVTPSELKTVIDAENDPSLRTAAAECFFEKASEFNYMELKQLVHEMLADEDAPDVRVYGLWNFEASYASGASTGSDLWQSKAKVIQILNEDPVAKNKASAAKLLGLMDPIPENQIEEPLLDLLSHSDTTVVKFSFETLMRFSTPPEQQIDNAFLNNMQHSNSRQRVLAANILGSLYENDPDIDQSVVDLFAAALNDENMDVRIQVARSLEGFGAQAASAAPDLAAIVWDPRQPPHVRSAARKAEEAITGERTRPPWLGQSAPPPHPGGNAAGSQ